MKIIPVKNQCPQILFQGDTDVSILVWDFFNIS